jgi:lipopolysaccharide transport protein LptA
VLSLSSTKGDALPVVTTERARVDANAIEVTLSPVTVTASGSVRTTLNANRRKAGERGNTLLKDSEPVTIAAESLALEESAGRSLFKDKTLLLQGATSIKADQIALDDKQGDLVATGNVVTVLPIAGKTAEGGGSSMSTGRAGEFAFADVKRRATFSKNAQLDGVQGNVRADIIELMLAEKDNTLDRMEAQGSGVRVVLEKKEAAGIHLTYLPAQEEYRLLGSPVRFVEGCRETTGRSLTFFGSSDRLLVDGAEEQRTQSRGNSKCPDSPNR